MFFLQEVKIKKDPVHREFKRAKGGERRPKVLFQISLVFITCIYVVSHIYDLTGPHQLRYLS